MEVLNSVKVEQLGSEIGVDNVPILLEIFLGELAQYIANLQQCPTNQDEYLREISHALKSSAASFGAEALCALANEYDAVGKAGQLLNTDQHKQQMLSLLNETEQRYKDLLSQ